MPAQLGGLVSLLLELISSLAAMQLNFAMLTVHLNYVKQLADTFKLLSLSDGRIGQFKRLGGQSRPIRFWVRAGRPSAWWDNFVNQIEIEEEWQENFRISRSSLYKLADQLRPYSEDETTIMRAPVDAVKRVAVTFYYLSDECCFRKTAKRFWAMTSSCV